MDFAKRRLIIFKEDGVEQGGVEFPEERDENRSVTFILRPGTTRGPGPHWHEIKTEYLEVIQGRALVTVDDSTALFGPDDGVITVPRLTIHSFQRADAHPDGAAWRDVELRIREWTSPPDGRKEAFFRNMLGVLEDRRGGVAGVARLVLGLAAVMWEHDNYPVLVRGPAFMGSEAQLAIRRAVTHAVLGGVHFVARLCGIRGTYEEYTPKDILEELKQK